MNLDEVFQKPSQSLPSKTKMILFLVAFYYSCDDLVRRQHLVLIRVYIIAPPLSSILNFLFLWGTTSHSSSECARCAFPINIWKGGFKLWLWDWGKEIIQTVVTKDNYGQLEVHEDAEESEGFLCGRGNHIAEETREEEPPRSSSIKVAKSNPEGKERQDLRWLLWVRGKVTSDI